MGIRNSRIKAILFRIILFHSSKPYFVFVTIISALLGVQSTRAFALNQVGLYNVWETPVTNYSSYSNPFDFRVIELQVIFTSPSGRLINFIGFYDGDGKGGQTGAVWKLRFMPDELGSWSYTYTWSDGTSGGSGSFCVADRKNGRSHGHVHVDPDHPRYLIHDDGTPHYWWGGSWIGAGSYGPRSKKGAVNASHITDEQFIAYLDTLQEYGHNGLLMKIALFPLEDDKYSWDVGWINRAEWLVGQMLARGIYVQINFFDTWSRGRNYWSTKSDAAPSAYIHRITDYFKKIFRRRSVWKSVTDGAQHVFNVWEPGDEDPKKNYIKTIIARFASFPNVYWELGNEMEHAPNSGEAFVNQANSKYIPWIRQYDPYDLPIGLSEGVWQKAEVDIGFLHQTESLPKHSWERPTIMNELVSGGISGSLWKDSTIRDAANRLAYRRTFWRMFTYAGCGSSEATWLNFRAPFNQAVYDVMADHQRLRLFLESLPAKINEMDVDNTFVISGPGHFMTRKKHGGTYVTYFLLEPGQSVDQGIVKVLLPKGTYDYAWYNPSNGQSTSPSQITSGSGTASLVRPAFAEDIVLKIVRANSEIH